MKKMYTNPKTEVMDLKTTSLMITMSPNGDNGGGSGVTDAPARRGDIID